MSLNKFCIDCQNGIEYIFSQQIWYLIMEAITRHIKLNFYCDLRFLILYHGFPIINLELRIREFGLLIPYLIFTNRDI